MRHVGDWLRRRMQWRVVMRLEWVCRYHDTGWSFSVMWVLQENGNGKRRARRSPLPMYHDRYSVDGSSAQTQVWAWVHGAGLPKGDVPTASPPNFRIIPGGAA